MTMLEKETGRYHEYVKMSGRRGSRGWSVSPGRQGRWRIQLTSMLDGRPHQVEGTFRTRALAEQAARDMIAELRGEAA